MKLYTGVDELEQVAGTHLGHSDWHTVTQHQIDQFAEATGDHQWIHVDPERAAAGPYGATIAHGCLTLSMIPMMLWEIYDVDGFAMGVNYGSNRVRFPAAVPVNSRLRAGAELVSVQRTPAGAQLIVRVTIEREGTDKPVCIADVISALMS